MHKFIMANVIVKTREEAGISFEQVYALVDESFKKWTDNGIEAPFLHYGLEEYKQVNRHTVIHVAIDSETGELLGARSHAVNRKKGYVSDFHLSVAPKARRMGIATKIMEAETEWAKSFGIRYMLCTTAVKADWSVRWHLKNGYRIIGYKHAQGNNHATYLFRKQLVPSLFWDSAIFCRCCFLVSYAITKLTKDSNGRPNLVGRVLKKIIGKSKAQ